MVAKIRTATYFDEGPEDDWEDEEEDEEEEEQRMKPGHCFTIEVCDPWLTGLAGRAIDQDV